MITTINTEKARTAMSVEERGVLEDYLRDRGLKMTGPRETVLEAFLKLERHVTAEELLAASRRLDPSIGQATVFRTIKLFAEAGLAREACPDEGGRRYEHAYRHEHHDHLVCERCGKIVEFRDEAIERAQEAIYRAHGYRPGGHLLELKGQCPDCAKGAKKKRK
jgi:Fur family ferric uptake transcriptional regulator